MTQGYRTTCPHCGKDLGPIRGEVELPAVWKTLLALKDLDGLHKAVGEGRLDSPFPYRDDSRETGGIFLDDGCTACIVLSSGDTNYWIDLYVEDADTGLHVYESDALFIEDLDEGVIKFESHDVVYEITVKWV